MNLDVQQSAWRNRIVGHGDEAPGQLLANPRNWRLHPKHQQDALSGILGEVGWVQEITVNRRTGFVVDGHLRVALAVSRRERLVPVRYVDLDEDEEALVLATLDPIGAMASSDAEQLSALLEGLEPADEAVAKLLRELAPRTKQLNPDDADLTLPEEPVTQPGDLWLLGDHRLLCGDSTDKSAWETVLDGEHAAVCLTDPPYGIGLDYQVFEDIPENVSAIAVDWLPLARHYAPVVAFTCGVTRQWLYPEPTWVLCWFFGGGQLCSAWGFSCWQPILVYGADPSLASGNGRRPDAFDLNIPANSADLDHPCPKPVALWAALIERLSFEQDDVIVDAFGGAGTTLVACEQTSRAARVIELNPRYVDVAIRRWERVSGRQAVKANA